MTKIILIVATCLAFLGLNSQHSFAQGNWGDKITWSFKVQKDDMCHATIIASAKVIQGWHVFSVNHDPSKADLTGYPTTFKFKKSPNYTLLGKLMDGSKPKVHTDQLGVSLYFENTAEFKQRIEIIGDKAFDVAFDYSFQICDENGCIFPPDQEAVVKIAGYTPCKIDPVKAIIDPIDEKENQVQLTPAEEEKLFDEDSIALTDKNVVVKEQLKKKVPMTESSMSFWGIFIAGFAGGLIALLTPCVFPMIPMTVTFFTKQSKSRSKGIINAFIYGFSIILIYVALGLLISGIMGPTGLNELSTNVWMNLIFFIIFIVFAVSFLGAFEIRMPASWVNKADSNADKGGMLGIFFMAFTLSLVSFSCTGPIIGSLLVEAASSGSMMGPAIGMIGFSSALAIPFTLFAIFPGWLNSLPQSGGWLNSVKVVLGLLELALSLKFLSMVDLAYHWDILTREVFVAAWVIIFLIIGFYLLGKIRFSHDSKVEKLSVTRFMFALFSLIFALYLLPGMWGAPLKLIEGIAPPRTHSEDSFRFVKGSGEGAATLSPLDAEYAKYLHEVGDGSIHVFQDIEIAKEYAQKAKKPLLVDFTGHACNNCRKTEGGVWMDDKIRPLLQNDFVIVSLYCDDRDPLPESEWKYSEAIKGKIKTVGNKWSDYQVRKYGQISQPLYIIADSEGNDLTDPIGYTPDIDDYLGFLEGGLKKFKAIK
jgi:thiol:disulfide interchange protein